MLEKVNLLQAANSASLFEYLNVGQLNGHTLSVLQAENRATGRYPRASGGGLQNVPVAHFSQNALAFTPHLRLFPSPARTELFQRERHSLAPKLNR